MLTLTFTEAVLRRHATTQSFDRGEAYAKSGAVASLTLRGQVLQAEVEGSDVQPYRVTAQFDQGGITTADCTCEYSFEGWCKHIVAMLLVSLRQPNTIEPRPTLAQLLDRLNPLQTQQLLQTLVDHHPELIDEIDRHINSTPTSKPAASEAKSVRRTEIDPAPVRRRVRQIIRDGIRDLEDGSEEDPITEDLEEVIQDAQAFSESGDGNSAIVILAAITQACAEDWSDLEDYGADSDATVAALNEAWTEAILSAELTPEQVVDLQIELESQQDSLGSFEMSLVALRQGWTYPPLLRVLAGEISELGSWEGDAPDYSDDLALIRLRILDRQARYDEYLHLAEAEGQTQCYLTMLAQLGRITEAVSAAQTNMSIMEEAFALAKTLRDQNAVPEALEIAQAGLSLPGHCGYDFATWTSDLAQGLGHPDLALRAGTIAFNLRPSFANYRQVEALAGSTWTTHKIELLARLRASQRVVF
jgi:uncharacterized Zn finger protein